MTTATENEVPMDDKSLVTEELLDEFRKGNNSIEMQKEILTYFRSKEPELAEIIEKLAEPNLVELTNITGGTVNRQALLLFRAMCIKLCGMTYYVTNKAHRGQEIDQLIEGFNQLEDK